MASIALPTKSKGFENSPAVLMGRITGSDGTPIQQADISGILLEVFELKTGTQQGSDVTLTVADVLYDTLQTSDVRWDADTTGYNFAYEVAGSYFPEGDKTYQVEVTFTPVSGNPFKHLWQHQTINVWGE